VGPKQHEILASAIQKREVLRFFYEGFERIVEPQTYGMSFTDRYVLRALQTGGASESGQTRIANFRCRQNFEARKHWRALQRSTAFTQSTGQCDERNLCDASETCEEVNDEMSNRKSKA
jgi:hypothetical protein